MDMATGDVAIFGFVFFADIDFLGLAICKRCCGVAAIFVCAIDADRAHRHPTT